MLAGAREYVRETQQRLIVAPLFAQVRSVYSERAEVEERLLALLDHLRARADYAQGYGPANLLALLRGHLRGLDLSGLSIRGAYLQGVQMQDTRLAGSHLHEAVWTAPFDAVLSIAVSPDGRLWAAGSNSGEVRVWRQWQEGRAVCVGRCRGRQCGKLRNAHPRPGSRHEPGLLSCLES